VKWLTAVSAPEELKNIAAVLHIGVNARYYSYWYRRPAIASPGISNNQPQAEVKVIEIDNRKVK